MPSPNRPTPSSCPTAEYGAPCLPITSTTKGHPMTGRCAAAHPDDPTPCDGPAAVTVRDAQGAWTDGCEHHAARPAGLEGSRICTLPHASAGAAIRVLMAAGPLPAAPGAVVITCPRCKSTRTREYGLAIPTTHDDYADCAGCLDCGHAWGLDPGADGACADCGGSGDIGGTTRGGRCPCTDMGER